MTKKHTHLTGADCKKMRVTAGLNQMQFWGIIGVTQSGGSRYETSSRPLPKTVEHLVRLIHEPTHIKSFNYYAKLRDMASKPEVRGA